MSDEQEKAKIEKKEGPETFDELREKVAKKEKTDVKEIVRQIATRDILERDYKEDLLEITFNSSPETIRKIKAKRPTPKQMTEIMKLSTEASIYENNPKMLNEKSIERMTSIYENLSEIAAGLCVDTKLDKKFWNEMTSSYALSSFIGELMKVTMQGPISEGDLKSFR